MYNKPQDKKLYCDGFLVNYVHIHGAYYDQSAPQLAYKINVCS